MKVEENFSAVDVLNGETCMYKPSIERRFIRPMFRRLSTFPPTFSIRSHTRAARTCQFHLRRRNRPDTVYPPKLMKYNRGAPSAQFPGKLHDMISFAEAQGFSHVISFAQDGTAIIVHDPDRLLEILPHFGFSQTQYRSFQRQL
jgi:HSF-type DNA-binding